MTSSVAPQVTSPLRSLQEAADYLNTPVSTFRYWRQVGGGPKAIKIGRRLMYRQIDLDAYIEAQVNGGTVT